MSPILRPDLNQRIRGGDTNHFPEWLEVLVKLTLDRDCSDRFALGMAET
ncbi:MAG TPA: hypothetical protein PKY77_24240 [Phycisphaerae bacterium]|nr:hypothetical protein [Phycisphaerae bacterium]HRY71390.1 hypothetical protein [Phycisphaerae bacterium]HSA28537.1 hypothetical protein [Phycisphaerae bacterium]